VPLVWLANEMTTNADVYYDDAMAQDAPPPPSNKRKFIIVGVASTICFVVAIGGWWLYQMLKGKPAAAASTPAAASATPASTAPASKPPAAAAPASQPAAPAPQPTVPVPATAPTPTPAPQPAAPAPAPAPKPAIPSSIMLDAGKQLILTPDTFRLRSINGQWEAGIDATSGRIVVKDTKAMVSHPWPMSMTSVTAVALQSDGNFCVYGKDSLWKLATACIVNGEQDLFKGARQVVMQDDGNLCVYGVNPNGSLVFLWGSKQAASYRLRMLQI
jgi:pyruvate/2-oxoglutarate dehydrogenase complex dihydrolipoamide acyltransferase (E2) component